MSKVKTKVKPKGEITGKIDALVGKGWSMERIAAECAVSVVTLWRWRSGRSAPSRLALKSLQQLIEA